MKLVPSGNSTEALRLLREAWNEHDVAAGVAKFYGRMARLLYFLQLSLNAASVIVIVLLEQFEWQTLDVDQALFAIAMLSTSLISIIGFTNPVARWQRLRAAATQLESTIWLFRTRCGPFQVRVFSYDSDLEEKRLEAQLLPLKRLMFALNNVLYVPILVACFENLNCSPGSLPGGGQR